MAQSVGAVALDIVAGKNTLNNTIKSSMNEAQNTASSGSSGIANALGKIGSVAGAVGKTVVAGIGVASTAVVAMGKSAISAYADYEQLVGGVETLFKDSAGKVQEYADRAYQTAGMSANNYMETVTSFSASLLQSLGNDTVKASQKADMAIIDMSDNANKMGSDLETLKTAYAGFAKGQFMLLDNLKLGYGGTATEMQRLLNDAQKISGIKYDISSYADIVDAIHVVQTEMGITGTTAKEASSTISGSISQMKSSWSNLLTSLADEESNFYTYIENFVDSVGTVADNIIPRIGVTLDGIVLLVQELAPKIISEVPKLLSQLVPNVISAATSLIQAIAVILPDLINMLVTTAIPSLLSGIVDVANSILQALPSVAESIFSALPTLLPLLIESITSLIVTLCSVLPQVIQPIIDNLPSIIISLVSALVENTPLLIDGIISLILGIVSAIPQIIQGLISATPTVISLLIQAILGNLPAIIGGLIQVAWEITKSLPQICASLIEGILNTFKGVWDGIKNVFSGVGSWAHDSIVTPMVGVFQSVIDWVAKNWKSILLLLINPFWAVLVYVYENCEGVRNFVNGIVSSIGQFFVNMWTNIKDAGASAFSGVKNVWGGITSFFGGIVDKVKSTFAKVKDAVLSPFKNAINAVKNLFSGMKLSFPDIKLPHFGISPSGWKIGDLLKGSIPKLKIDWYAKAMNNPMIMNKPTIFGYDAGTGNLLGGGEAGSELVVGTNTLLSMIKSAVASVLGGSKLTIEVPALQNVRAGSAGSDNGLSDKIDGLIELFKQFIEYGDSNMTVPIYIGNELIDEYILNKNNRNVLRSGGHA